MGQVQIAPVQSPVLPNGTAAPRAQHQVLDGTNYVRKPVSERVETALLLLSEAAAFAQDVNREIWEFSVEIESLRALGLTNNDFRWMVARGLAVHARETTDADVDRRLFVPSNSLSFTDRTCFVITPRGSAQFKMPLRPSANRRSKHHRSSRVVVPFGRSPAVGAEPLPATPTWDSDRQQLRVGRVIVKEFKVPAMNQETILAAFQEEGWCPRIHDPLVPNPNQETKRRLHDTINSLNRNQKTVLIRFMGDGKGEGIRWEFPEVPAKD